MPTRPPWAIPPLRRCRTLREVPSAALLDSLHAVLDRAVPQREQPLAGPFADTDHSERAVVRDPPDEPSWDTPGRQLAERLLGSIAGRRQEEARAVLAEELGG